MIKKTEREYQAPESQVRGLYAEAALLEVSQTTSIEDLEDGGEFQW